MEKKMSSYCVSFKCRGKSPLGKLALGGFSKSELAMTESPNTSI